MNAMKLLAAASVLAVLPIGGAGAQTVVPTVAGATYDQSLKCYQYYDINQQIDNARAAKASGDAQQKLQSNALVDKALKAAWNKNIDATKEKRTNKQIDTDMDGISGAIVKDANAALGGDAAATARMDAIHTTCKGFEKMGS